MDKFQVNPNNAVIRWMMQIIQHYNHNKYWKYRKIVVSTDIKYPKWIKIFMLYYIKRCDAYNNASMGTNLNYGAQFKSPPHLPHGLNGIIIHPEAVIGGNCTIYQQVTIAGKNGRSAEIGDNVSIGAGAKIIGNVSIGDNVRIGANAEGVNDVPSNCTGAGVPARFVSHNT